MKKFWYLIGYFLVVFASYAQESALADGQIFKVGITSSGVYKIDRNVLDALGFPSIFDPRNLQVFGNGWQGVLPQMNSVDRPFDLIENAIRVEGEADGSFDSDDYILFYGVGPDLAKWSDQGFLYEKNIYSDTSYYFLKIGTTPGKRIQTKSSLSGIAQHTAQSFDDSEFYEEDVTNLQGSGRVWIGASISSGSSERFNYLLEGLSSDVNLHLSAVNQSNQDARFEINSNGALVGSLAIDKVPDGPGTTYSIKARQKSADFTFAATENVSLDIRFNGNAAGERGFIDFFYLTFQRSLELYGDETDFRWIGNVGNMIRYEVSDASNATIWNITSPTEPAQQDFTLENGKAVFQSLHSGVEEFVIFNSSGALLSPVPFGPVSNQDLKSNVAYEGIIITHPDFLPAAQKLASFHRQRDNLNVGVVTTRQVYNEFSSGRQDITAIRDYGRYLYDAGGSLQYLLLFGDCSYDYKDRVNRNTNFVPTYESRQSYDPIFSYSSDDYFGFFEENEGEWVESFSGDHTLEIGVGRLPAKTLQEANVMVDKIIYYCTSPNTLGRWRSNITYVADDGDNNIHANHVERLSELIDSTYAFYDIDKLLLDSYTQVANGASELSPQARSSLKRQFKNGTFLINYIGHGSELLWMEEQVLTFGDISELNNRNRLPIIVTATCEYGRYDNPSTVSGAEALLLRAEGGAIALLTTSRPVFASTNFSLNQAFHQNIFRKENGKNLRLGDVMRFTKNEGLEGAVNRNFTLLGNPMMMPAYPKLEVEINELGSELDTLSALEEITLTGQITQNGSVVENFNGQLVAGIYDSRQSYKTKGQESDPYTYQLRSNALFRGESTVTNGRFSFTFRVPKNISYQYLKGKLNVYAWDQNTNQDAEGSSRQFVIGGTASQPGLDEKAPEVNLYLNDESFKSGDIVGNSPLLIAEISDDNGITTTSTGVLQGITLDLNGEIINLNNFYTAKRDSYQQGTVVFPLELDAGRYKAKIKVWDTFNNATERTIDFVVSEEPEIFIFNPAVYPNPVLDQEASLVFEHDREDEDLIVNILVYNSQGRLISKSNFLIENSDRRVELNWQAATNSGQPLNRGVYFLKAIIRSRFDSAMKEFNQKVVISN